MSPKSSRAMAEEEDIRGGRGCFGKKKRGRRLKHKDAEPSLTSRRQRHPNEENGQAEACSATDAAEDVGEERLKEQDKLKEEEQEPKVVMIWAGEVDNAEEKGLDVFASQNSCPPHTASVHCEISASPENKATTAAATKSDMSAC
ncbi:hypothetical protein E2C01_032749 [Portunus trituberculatus]|uniref:Uncharacterized protein n=1 Tax=Portunus trituberculatus TaxID=210409 RepID=A0A5B7EWQ6_PORTR|nr:hypothetical protein [Portunus trituberculatus]